MSRLAKIVIILGVIIIISLGGFLVLPQPSSTLSTNTTTKNPSLTITSTQKSSSSTGSGTGYQCPCPPYAPNQFVDEAIGAGAYDSLDPSYGFFTEDGFFMDVFQGLLSNPYNGTAIDPTQTIPSLASDYAVTGSSPICVGPTSMRGGSSNCIQSALNYTQYNFIMRSDAKFSNSDPVNAYDAWFSFVRVLWYNAPTTVGIANYAGLTVNTTIDEPCFNGTLVAEGCGENIWPDGLMNAVIQGGGLTTVSPSTPAGQNELVGALNQMLSNYDPSENATQAAIVGYPNQAYVARNNSSFTINLIEPYKLFPLALTAQWAAIQDPKYIDQKGGLENNTGLGCASAECSYFNNNGMPGTGPYMYNCPEQCPPDHLQLELVSNPNYWGDNVTGLNPVLGAAHISDIIIKFGLQSDTIISDFASNAAQVISIPYSLLGQAWSSFHSSYPQHSFDQVFSDQGVPLCDTAIEINTRASSTFGETYTGNSSNPSTIAASTLVRQAIVHAVNYSAIKQQLYMYNNTSLGELFLPPVPPGYGPLDNPDNTPLYSYNITLAAIDLDLAGKSLGFYTVLPSPIAINGISYNELGDNKTGNIFSSIVFEIIPPLTPNLQTEIGIINLGLQKLGISLGLPSEGGCDSASGCGTSPETTPPISTGEWCGDWADPILQQFYAMGTSIAHQPSWPNNATLNSLLSAIPFETNSTLQRMQTVQAYQIFTQMATMIQVPTGIDNGGAFMIQPYVQNLVYSFAQSGYAYNMVTFS